MRVRPIDWILVAAIVIVLAAAGGLFGLGMKMKVDPEFATEFFWEWRYTLSEWGILR